MDVEQRSILTLSLIYDVGPKRFQRLIEHFGSAKSALDAPKSEILYVEDINNDLAGRIVSAKDTVNVENEIELAKKLGIKIVTYIDDEYPEDLKNLYDYPPVMYIKGSLKEQDALGIAVVGTRKPTNYGRNVAMQFGKELADFNVTTISGFARGIDIEVHKATLNAEGRTIAVLGNGLNHHYPPENRKYEDKIIKQGALISEFPINFPPDKANFPRRNRIISGLALATLVIEAGIKSGALITAKYSCEQGKDVFAVPGQIYSKYSEGTHYLIKSGARLVENAGEIIEEMRPLEELVKKSKPKTVIQQKDINLLDAKDKKIMNVLDQYLDGITIDYLAKSLDIPLGELAAGLLDLELKGLIRSLPGKVYIKNQC
ncbi:MAG: DNA-processing protein DprA [Endomicrobiales bacterium]|nr:DNA-processing protein DprA [Endomicrobiales bacterium]